MAKYRLLSIDELKELEKEFIDYLIVVGIVADDWEKMKSVDPEKADKIIDLFSDMVFENIMQKTNYIQWRGEKELRVAQCLKDKFVVVGIDASKIQDANFNDSVYLNNAMQNPPSNLKVYTSKIPYELSREEEIFKMTERGYQISDGELYKILCMVLPQ